MKIVILGDTHFGSSYSIGKVDPFRCLNSRLIDFSNTFDYVVDYMVEHDVKHFILTGDIFEYRRPRASELSIFSEKIHRLEDLGIYTHIIIGNHDIVQDQKTTTVDVLQKLKLPKTFIYSDIDSVVCTDDTNNVINVIFFPYRTRSMLNCTTNEIAIKRLNERLKYELNGISNNGMKILIGHFIIQESVFGNITTEGSADQVVFPITMFNKLDAVVVGHIHAHSVIQENKPFITYLGSMECKDFGEAKQNKYFLFIDYKDDNEIIYQFEKLPVRKLYDITIDKSSVKSDIVNCIIEDLNLYTKDKDMFGSIVRLNILINEKAACDLDTNYIKSFMKSNFKISHCVGIHTQIVSKRQLRKDTITEKIDPVDAFNEYLELIDDDNIKDRMREFGINIIKEQVQ